MARAFAEPPEREVLSATVDGRFVTTRSKLRGTLVDGTPSSTRPRSGSRSTTARSSASTPGSTPTSTAPR